MASTESVTKQGSPAYYNVYTPQFLGTINHIGVFVERRRTDRRLDACSR
jgi:hypothetical protein